MELWKTAIWYHFPQNWFFNHPAWINSINIKHIWLLSTYWFPMKFNLCWHESKQISIDSFLVNLWIIEHVEFEKHVKLIWSFLGIQLHFHILLFLILPDFSGFPAFSYSSLEVLICTGIFIPPRHVLICKLFNKIIDSRISQVSQVHYHFHLPLPAYLIKWYSLTQLIINLNMFFLNFMIHISQGDAVSFKFVNYKKILENFQRKKKMLRKIDVYWRNSTKPEQNLKNTTKIAPSRISQ